MATTTNFGWETPDDTDLVKDGAAAMRTLGNSIDTSFVDLKGGTTGQVLAKASNTDLDYTWVAQDDSNAIQNAIVDAKGDLISATAADTPARLGVGTDGQVLTADSTTSTGLKWATASGGSLKTQEFTSTGTFSVPAGVTKLHIMLVGGGGGAGGIAALSGAYHAGSGGGGGGAVNIRTITVTPSTNYTVTIGAGGSGGVGSGTANATAGSESSFGTLMYAGGGGEGGSSSAGTGGYGTGGGAGGGYSICGNTLSLVGGSGGGGFGSAAGTIINIGGVGSNINAAGGNVAYGGGSGPKLGGDGSAGIYQTSANSNYQTNSPAGSGYLNYGNGGPGGNVTNNVSMYMIQTNGTGITPSYRSSNGQSSGTNASANTGGGGSGANAKLSTSSTAVNGGNGGSGYCLVSYVG